jgi:flagellar hook-associated protein 1 FlgK
MSLSTALSIAQNSLLNTQRQTSVVSKNMANQYNGDYSRRAAVISSLGPGSQVATISRATSTALFKQNLAALSGWTAQSTIVDGLDHLQLAVNGVDNATSPATLIGTMQRALEFFSATPSNRTLAENVVEAARQVALGLNQGTSAIQAFRADLDGQIAASVAELNQLLADFKMVNDEIIKGAAGDRDVLDSLDRRDALLKKISEIVPISTISRSGGDTMIVTADGSTLFETIPRHVHFEPTPAYGATSVGNNVLVDGVPLFSATGANTTGSGTLSAMLQLRDGYANGLQLQLDEIARGLISAFSESGGDGLFTVATGSTVPPGSTGLTGLAGAITLNPLVDPTRNGDPLLLRDGITTDYNPDDLASFNERLFAYIEKLDAPASFVTASGSAVSQSLTAYSAAAIGWLEDARKTSASAAEAKSALAIRSAEALSNVTGVNVDEELALMLELEHSYSASAKMLQVVDEMLRTLLAAVR